MSCSWKQCSAAVLQTTRLSAVQGSGQLTDNCVVVFRERSVQCRRQGDRVDGLPGRFLLQPPERMRDANDRYSCAAKYSLAASESEQSTTNQKPPVHQQTLGFFVGVQTSAEFDMYYVIIMRSRHRFVF